MDPVQANCGQAIFAEQRTEISLNRLNVDERGDCTETSESLSVHSRLLDFLHSEKNCALCAAICSTIPHARVPKHKAVKHV